MTSASCWPVAQVAFSHSRICAMLMIGTGIAGAYRRTSFHANGSKRVGRTLEEVEKNPGIHPRGHLHPQRHTGFPRAGRRLEAASAALLPGFHDLRSRA